MDNSNISNVAPKLSPAQIYGDAGLVYIRYHAQIETKPNGQKKIGGSRPALSRITEQINYGSNSGDYYSLLMGREFKPGRWSILLDFDNKVNDASHSGLDLAKKLNMDQYDAPNRRLLLGVATT
ncbi:MAG: hypothetical protein ACKPKO_41055, partial [Candidatus Fonsibacter sp.]